VTGSLWTTADFLTGLRGRLVGQAPAAVNGISIDTRTIQPGDAFFAIRGDRLDGHDYVAAAFEAGAVTAVVAEDRATAALVAFGGGGLRFALSEFDVSAIIRSLALSAGVFLIAGAFEEALFRGYVFQTFTRAGLGWFALVITSCFFGVVHLMNPNAGTISTINTMLAGLWLGVVYLKTRDLWFPLGVHMAWNWMKLLSVARCSSPSRACTVTGLVLPFTLMQSSSSVAMPVES
jgi:hypothetical protein